MSILIRETKSYTVDEKEYATDEEALMPVLRS